MKLKRTDRHICLKCSEELIELSLELLHAVNKPSKENAGKIRDEIGDVEKYISLVKDCLDGKS